MLPADSPRRAKPWLSGQLSVLPGPARGALLRRVVPLALATGGAALVTVGLVAIRPYTTGLSNLYLLYLVWVLVCAVRWGLGAAAAAAAVGVLTYDYLFLKPPGVLHVRAADDWLELAIFLAAAALTSRLAIGARERAAAAARAEAEAQSAVAADRLKAALLASLSHDLRTPLASLRAAAGTLQTAEAQLDPETRAELLGTLEEESARLSAILTDLLDLSRLQAGALEVRREWCPVDELLWTAVDRAPGVAERRIEATLPLGLPTVHLTPTEYELLKHLALHAGKVVTHRQLLQAVWGPAYADESHYLRVFVNQLRKKLEPDPSHPQYVLTDPGVGYRFREDE